MMLFKLFANNANGFRDSMNPAARAGILQVTAYNITLKEWKKREQAMEKKRGEPQGSTYTTATTMYIKIRLHSSVKGEPAAFRCWVP